MLGLLKGSFIFLSDLVREIRRPLQVDFLVAASYGDAMVSSGSVRLVYDPETKLEGKHILLVEDIVDSGRTLSRLMDLLSGGVRVHSRCARSFTSTSPSICGIPRSSWGSMRQTSSW